MAILYSDTFTAPNGTLLSAHTSESGHTYSPAGTAEIQSGVLTGEISYSAPAQVVGLVDSGGSFFASIVFNAGSLLFVIYRGDPLGDAYAFIYSGTWYLYRITSGFEWAELDQDSTPLTGEVDLRWEVSADGAVHNVYLGEVLILAAVDPSPHPLGGVHFFFTGTSGSGFDAMRLEDLDEGPSIGGIFPMIGNLFIEGVR